MEETREAKISWPTSPYHLEDSDAGSENEQNCTPKGFNNNMKTLILKPIPTILLGAFLAFIAQAPTAAAEIDGRTVIPAAAKPQETFSIDQPGSYYLGGNRHAADTAIKVLTNNVTIDLNGFCLVGSETGKTHGVFLQGVRNVEIRNGTLMNFGDRAIAGDQHQEGSVS